MERLGRFVAFWTILFFCDYLRSIDGKFVPEHFGEITLFYRRLLLSTRRSSYLESLILERKLLSLSKVIDYIGRRPHQMNADVTLSITIVQVNIASTLLHEHALYLRSEYREILTGILQVSDSIRRYLLGIIIPGNEDVRLLHETLNNPVLWMRAIPWRNGALETWKANCSLTWRNIREVIMQGTPKEEESDRCLAQIIRNKSYFGCSIPELCVEILMEAGLTRGYPLTHRLLIVQVAKAMKCDQPLPVSSDELILYYCSKILQDLIDIERAGFPSHTPMDLMMEEVLLCGMEGFLEFTDDHYQRLITSWSHPSGCFSSFGNGFSNDRIHVARRSSAETDFGCDNHATGLAAAALSLFIRKNVEIAFD
nr:PREDICTED: uncharacterized protein LOC100877494 [Megachile rotundata]